LNINDRAVQVEAILKKTTCPYSTGGFLVTMLLGVSIVSTARAGGLEYPDNGTIAVGRGGAFGARADDLTAIYFNPAGLAGQRGTRLMLNANIINNDVTYTMRDATGEYDPVHNSAGLFFAPMGAISTDFGLKNITFALGIYGPSAVGNVQYPENGVQRYELISMETLMAYYTFAFGARLHPKLDIGMSFQWADMYYSRYTEMVNAWFGDGQGPESGYDAKIKIDFSDRFAFAMLVGAMYRPTPAVTLGLTLRPLPVHLNCEGTIKQSYPGGFLRSLDEKGRVYLSDNGAHTSFSLPVMLRLAGRYAHIRGDNEIFDVEADVVYEAWSLLKEMRVRFDGAMVIKQDVGTDDAHPINEVSIPRKYKDTVSVRLGGDYNVIPKKLALRMGGFYESGAVPVSSTNLDFLSFPRFGIGTGVTWSFWGFDLSAAYEHVFVLTQTVPVDGSDLFVQMPMSTCQYPYTSESCEVQGQPTGRKIGAGKYETGIDVLSVGLTVRFDGFKSESNP